MAKKSIWKITLLNNENTEDLILLKLWMDHKVAVFKIQMAL